MSIHPTRPGAYADLGDAWLRGQLARLTQKNLQFGGRYRIDADALLARSARTARIPAGDRVRQAALEIIEPCARPENRVPQPPSHAERRAGALLDELAMLAIPSEFLPIHRPGSPRHGEWMAVLPDGTAIAVAGVQGKPCPIGIEKAIAIVQSRAYLEARARRLLAPLIGEDGEWRLAVIDFGAEARRHGCEFLMCFALQTAEADSAAASPYAEVGFALHVRPDATPAFILSIQTAIGECARCGRAGEPAVPSP